MSHIFNIEKLARQGQFLAMFVQLQSTVSRLVYLGQACSIDGILMEADCVQVIEHMEELRAMKEPTALGHPLSLGPTGTPADTMGQAATDQPLLEAVLGHGLRHPNVVETYKYATKRAEVCFVLMILLLLHSFAHTTSIAWQ